MSHVAFLIQTARAQTAVINSPCIATTYKQQAAQALEQTLTSIERAAYSGDAQALEFVESLPVAPEVNSDVILIVVPTERYECYRDGKVIAVFGLLESAVEHMPNGRIEWL